MTFEELAKKAESKKIVINEIDVPVTGLVWINHKAGIWATKIVLGDSLVYDDRGNSGYYGSQNTIQYNINSVTIDGAILAQVQTLAEVEVSENTWFYDESTTYLYVAAEDYNPLYTFTAIKPGGALGFTDQVNRASSNYFKDQHYSDRILSIPNLSKAKDSIFFGKLQFPSNSVQYANDDGYFDNFAEKDLYGQPSRIKLLFEGIDYGEAITLFTGKLDKLKGDFSRFTASFLDPRKLISRSLPVNSFDAVTYPDISEEDEGSPIPIIFGTVEKVPAYRISLGVWKFADTQYYAIDSGIIVYREDGTVFTHGGTGTDGTFTGSDTGEKLFVSCSQTTVQNGLDVISSLVESYNNIVFSSANYDLEEWESEKSNVENINLWIGKGNILTCVKVIEQVCVDNQGIFDVLADGRFSFRTFDPDKQPAFEIRQDELLGSPSFTYDPNEFLSSVKIEYGKNYQTGENRIYTNTDFQGEVFLRYAQYKERSYSTALLTLDDAKALSNDVMEQSKEIKPIIIVNTKIQHINAKILDNVAFTLKRENGKVIIPRSSYQLLGFRINLSTFSMEFTLKFIQEIPEGPVRKRKVKLLPNGKIKLLPNGIIKTLIIEE